MAFSLHQRAGVVTREVILSPARYGGLDLDGLFLFRSGPFLVFSQQFVAKFEYQLIVS